MIKHKIYTIQNEKTFCLSDLVKPETDFISLPKNDIWHPIFEYYFKEMFSLQMLLFSNAMTFIHFKCDLAVQTHFEATVFLCEHGA